MKLAPKHRTLTELVKRRAGRGTPLRVVDAKIFGACGGLVVERPRANEDNERVYHLTLTIKNTSTSKEGVITGGKNRCQNNLRTVSCFGADNNSQTNCVHEGRRKGWSIVRGEEQ
jgi:hypothetical protein